MKTEYYVNVGLWIKATDKQDAREKAIAMITTKPISCSKFEYLIDWEIVDEECE